MCILQYDGNGTTQVILVYQLDIDTVIGNAAAFNVVKPINQIGDCRFPAPVLPTNAIFCPGFAYRLIPFRIVTPGS